MRLRITTPLDIVVDEDAVLSIRAQDDSGSFGILPGHADFLTRLGISVVSWKGAAGAQRYCAVRGGLLTVGGGDDAVAIATREAVAGNDLATLEQTVLAHFRADIETERTGRVDSVRQQLEAIRRMVSHLRPSGGNQGLWS